MCVALRSRGRGVPAPLIEITLRLGGWAAALRRGVVVLPPLPRVAGVVAVYITRPTHDSRIALFSVLITSTILTPVRTQFYSQTC